MKLINLDLNWSENCVIVATNVAAQGTTFSITDTKNFDPVLTLLAQDNHNFQGVNRIFVLSFEVTNDIIFRLEK